MTPNLKARTQTLMERLAVCDLCPRRCGVDRTQGELGICRTGERALLAHVGLHFGEEPPISGTRGSGTIFFAHCNLRCVFCQNWQISQQTEQISTTAIDSSGIAHRMLDLQGQGAHNINLVSPSHVVAQIAEAICLAREAGLKLPVVYNTNAYDSVDSLLQLEGLIEIYLTDIKYADDEMARRYSGVDDYVTVSRAAIAEMHRQVGDLTTDETGIATGGLLVRHLVLPDGAAGSRDCLDFLASLSQDMVVGIMSQYTPRYKAPSIPALNRRITHAEYEDVVEYAIELGLERSLIQGLDSGDVLLPDFRRRRPFER